MKITPKPGGQNNRFNPTRFSSFLFDVPYFYIILGWIRLAIQLTSWFKSEGFSLKDSFHPARWRQNPTLLFASHLTVWPSLFFSSIFGKQTSHSNIKTFPQAMREYFVLLFSPQKHILSEENIREREQRYCLQMRHERNLPRAQWIYITIMYAFNLMCRLCDVKTEDALSQLCPS